MFNILYHKTKKTEQIEDKELLNKITELYPEKNKHFCKFVYDQLTRHLFWSNYDFTISHHLYSPKTRFENVKPRLKKDFADVPVNTQKLKHEPNVNQWFIYNIQNHKSCAFPSLAALARALNVDYHYLYNGIKNNRSFAIGKYRFTRNTIPVDTHCCNLLADIIS